jgi:hypothetical protein
MLKVYWSTQPKRDSPAGSQKPDSFDIVLDAVRHPQEFGHVLSRWIGRQADWHDARCRFFNSFSRQKIRYRARKLVEAVPEWFPSLFTVTDEAVNCRNHYVHGSRPRFDYNGNFAAVVFLTETLEFVFGASDLIEADWDIRSWILQGATMSHPFGR